MRLAETLVFNPHASEYFLREDVEDTFEQPRDPKLDPAKDALMRWFHAHDAEVFYGRQLEVVFEKTYFHWITHKALHELTLEGSILSEQRVTEGGTVVRIYWSKRYRFARRAARQLLAEIDQHSVPDLTHAIGFHAEQLFGFAAARAGFTIAGQNTRTYNGRRWTETEQDLDWIFVRNGVAWGVEIKNTWAYIDRPEMYDKLAVCDYLGLRALFIMRWAPKHYIEIIRNRNGFGLLYENQYFPPGRTEAVDRLRTRYLPVTVATEVAPDVFPRFVRWHERGLVN